MRLRPGFSRACFWGPRMIENYIVLRGQHGQYGEGSVLPRFVFEEAAGANLEARARVVAEMVERGQIAPTGLPVNRPVAKPVKLGAAVDPNRDVKAEFDRLRAANEELATASEAHQNRADKAAAEKEALAQEIAKYVTENTELRAAVKDRDEWVAALTAERDDLRKQVEALTAPPTPPKKK